jgi:hypothetical protein
MTILKLMFHLHSILRWRRNAPRWRALCDIESAAEAEIVSARCRYSLSTVEVLSNSAATFCALVERELPGVWRWAIFGVEDIARAQGVAPTKVAARRMAVKALIALGKQGVLKITASSPDALPDPGRAPDLAGTVSR